MPIDDATWWDAVRSLVAAHAIVIDRPAGSRHPRYPETIYPLDYGHLADTNGGDGSGIDVWIGTLGSRDITAALVCIDGLKREIETKLLLGCTDAEIDRLRAFHSEGAQSAIVLRPSRLAR